MCSLFFYVLRFSWSSGLMSYTRLRSLSITLFLFWFTLSLTCWSRTVVCSSILAWKSSLDPMCYGQTKSYYHDCQLHVHIAITVKFRKLGTPEKYQELPNVAICSLVLSHLIDWLFPHNTITFHKFFWCSQFCEFHSKCRYIQLDDPKAGIKWNRCLKQMGISVTTRVRVGLVGGEIAHFNYDFKVLALPIHFMPLGGKKESLE